jgi:starch-binding outer membrane protein, SusD/RagB family
MKFKKIFLILFSLTMLITCKKNLLDVPGIGLIDESKLENQKGVEALLIGTYSMLDGFAVEPNFAFNFMGGAASNWIYGSICGSEAYKGSDMGDQPGIADLEVFKPSPQNDMLTAKWSVVYAGIERANEVLSVMKKATDISPADQLRIAGEARFLRGLYHFEVIKTFGHVPYVDETVTYDAGNYFLPNDTLIWPAIENDLKFAMQNLSGKMNAPGRANKYAAEAFLAKTFLFQQKFADAKPLLDDLISNGMTASGSPYKLFDHYADNFNAATKNGSEAVFSVQMSVNDNSGGYNGNIPDIYNYPQGLAGINGGFFKPSQYLVNHFKTDPISGLPDLDHFNDSDVKSDQNISSDSAFTPYTGTIDPRLDWTVGRRGIPYLDWGIHPGAIWSRDQVYGGPYSPIKNVYYQSQQANVSDQSFWSVNASSATNVDLIRFSDILLWAAETEVEIGSLDKAEDHVNMIRNRMANNHIAWVHQYLDNSDPTGGSYTDDAHLAANYFIQPYPVGYFSSQGIDVARKAVRYERMLELGMEGHRFFDLVRWGIADTEINNYFQKEKNLRTYMIGAKFTKGVNEYFPIPQTQIDLSGGKMKQNNGY